MDLERYPTFASTDYQDYEFYSEGPKGRVKKIVRYQKINEKPIVYNLAFGDEDEETGRINDTSVTNNSDRDMVLATVAGTIIDFTNYHGNHLIHAKGSTPARTRLYQMGIASIWEEVSTDFEVYGLREGEWEEFKRGINYEAFFVKRK